MSDLETLRQAIRDAKFVAEDARVTALAAGLELTVERRTEIEDAATRLVESVRARRSEHSVLDVFLKEFGLANEEGVALMCLAEALLRIPDAATVDALIADKIVPRRWIDHIGNSESTFVNASTWALMLTGRVIALDRDAPHAPADVLGRLIGRAGEPVIRSAMRRAMKILGGEFVLGRDIDEAIRRGADDLGDAAVFSFDMLGEGARTAADAERYLDAYHAALERVGELARGRGARGSSGVSVKLSALHARYEFAHRGRVHDELYPRLLALALLAARHGVGLSIDAEEADRLELSLELYERLAREGELRGWDGLGLVVQAYGKRALPVVDWLVELNAALDRRAPVRLVKGAYWDAEVKRAQENGLPDFPVFTQKANTDVSYLACAERLLAARPRIYPQFTTHNAHTIAAVMALAGDADGIEFQRLHGMGELLYRVAADEYPHLPQVRVYAPVGGHRDLLAYLVRRLLENGANSSFVNRFLDANTPAREVVRDPVTRVARGPHRHPHIRLPAALYGPRRKNSAGLDLTDAASVVDLQATLEAERTRRHEARPTYAVSAQWPTVEVRNPADRRDKVGSVQFATDADVGAAVRAAVAAQPAWNAVGAQTRARVLLDASELIERDRDRFVSLLVREGGKTIPDAIAEVREATDYCRYYAELALDQFAEPLRLPGPSGEANELTLHGRGAFACISPWNFPLAIFLGQIVAALAAGNSVVAKPAEQTPLIGAHAFDLLREAGLPEDVARYLPGDGRVGATLVAHPDIAGVAFTGSLAAAQSINRALAARDGAIVPLIAETGGQNALFADSTALIEQLTDDVMRSAFGSAGQRCSALRVLLLQDDVADRALDMIRGAMAELTIGDPADLATDVGPLIEDEAVERLTAYVEGLRARGLRVDSVPLPAACANGSFMAPHVVELDGVDGLTEEHFGPVLHVVRYRADELDAMVAAVRRLGFGLTMGIHSRIDARAERIFERSAVGNTYVNRSIIGAVVGVQPFGGEGLSGTGPKAGGPHYLVRFATERARSINTTASGGNVELLRDG
ncbi:MAG TPA: bifunctional proline dehydrogenase/L-glutamate gamma-semialdehyde dehydrogenase PutA [Pseudomonadales bacterium]|nr:bifunctional proline dehydrogenase/L-glutamate gamma-semialdehyde dehydrogenase PutA [Pseudomonadales bacterium]